MAEKSGRSIVITGASQGIGRETAFRFARERWDVILTYHEDSVKGKAAAQRCMELGAHSSTLLQLDVSDPSSVQLAVEEIKRAFGKATVLVNNAGISIWKVFREQTPETISRQVRTNLEGLIIMTLGCIPLIEETIINLGSPAGICGYPGDSVYSATKAGIRGFTMSLAQEEKRLKIYTVYPRATATQMNRFHGDLPEKVANVIYGACTGRYDLPTGSDISVWNPSGDLTVTCSSPYRSQT